MGKAKSKQILNLLGKFDFLQQDDTTFNLKV